VFFVLFLIGGQLRVEKKGDEVLITNLPTQPVLRRDCPQKEEGYQAIINRVCRKYNMDPKLINLVIEKESGFNPRARSKKGAIGLMQLMPETARKLGVKNPYDPEENIEAGVRYLRMLLDRYKTLDLALAAYHAGPRAVEEARGVPQIPETVSYINYILSRYSGTQRDRIFCRIRRGEIIFTNIPE